MRLTILGASGHGRSVANIAKLNGYDEIEFLDDDQTVHNCGAYPVVGRCIDAKTRNNAVFVAIGNAEHRKKYMEFLNDKTIPTLIHPDAIIAEDAAIGTGTVVMPGVVIDPNVKIGKGCIINDNSLVGHDAVIGDYVHISGGVNVAGATVVGEMTWVGVGTTLSNNINICGCCMIGAGAVVVKDIEEPGTYVGVPARKLEK